MVVTTIYTLRCLWDRMVAISEFLCWHPGSKVNGKAGRKSQMLISYTCPRPGAVILSLAVLLPCFNRLSCTLSCPVLATCLPAGLLASHLRLSTSCWLPHWLYLLETGRKLGGGPHLMTHGPCLMTWMTSGIAMTKWSRHRVSHFTTTLPSDRNSGPNCHC